MWILNSEEQGRRERQEQRDVVPWRERGEGVDERYTNTEVYPRGRRGLVRPWNYRTLPDSSSRAGAIRSRSPEGKLDSVSPGRWRRDEDEERKG